MDCEHNRFPIITEQRDSNLWRNVIVTTTCDIIVKSGKKYNCCKYQAFQKKTFLDRLSLFTMGLFFFQFCNVFKVVAFCSPFLSFFFLFSFFAKPFLNNPKLRLLTEGMKENYMFVWDIHIIYNPGKSEMYKWCLYWSINPGYSSVNYLFHWVLSAGDLVLRVEQGQFSEVGKCATF